MLPVKFRLVQIISQRPGVSNKELFSIVKNEYPRERHVTQPGIDQYLMALKTVGIIEPSGGINSLGRTGAVLPHY